MSDLDQTVYSGGGAPGQQPVPPPRKRNPLLIVAGLGCVLLLCVLLLAGIGLYVARDQVNDIIAGLGGTPLVIPTTTEVVEQPTSTTETATDTPTPVAVSDSEATSEAMANETATAQAAPEETSTPLPDREPQLEPITFALGVTPDNTPISPTITFQEGITEVHAIFEYSGMSPDNTWERVWYLDDQELLRTAEPWSGEEAGVFDYFINAGGEPLSPGNWILELYVEDELLAEGDFVIEEAGSEAAQASLNTPTPLSTSGSSPTPAAALSPTPVNAVEPTPTPSPTATGGGVYKLAYTRWDGGQHNLYVGDTNGGSNQFIMQRAAGPSWTPDGRYLFFFGQAGVGHQNREDRPGVGDCELPTISDGIASIDMPTPPNDICIAYPEIFQDLSWKEGTARWTNVSPDGTMVAYDAKPGGFWRIYFLGTDTNQQFQYEIVGEQADWSPNSQKLVYRSGRDGITGIWISNRDGSGPTLITNGGSDSFPAWSPDGDTIVFSRDAGGNVDLYAVDVNGSNLRRLTDAPESDTLPIFTPDGQIIFRSTRNGRWGIWKMNGDGSNQQEIIPDAPVGPDWAYSRMDAVK